MRIDECESNSCETKLTDGNTSSISYPKKPKPINQHEKLERDLKKLVGGDEKWNDQLAQDLPRKWKSASSDMLILPETCFKSPDWLEYEKDGRLWGTLAECFRVKRICKENRVQPDELRSPGMQLVYGNDSIVTVTNNGIKYSYDVTKSMFCWGNITEKLRLAEFDCSNETIVDLYAVYLIHCKAAKVIACEWNSASVRALENNLILNKCQDRCEILEGDNRKTCPENCADRVNLGLIPTSEDSWPTACRALRKETGGFLHIHGNVDIKMTGKAGKADQKAEWTNWSEKVRNRIKKILDESTKEENVEWKVENRHLEYVKSYGPRVDHMVLDLECRPSKIYRIDV